MEIVKRLSIVSIAAVIALATDPLCAGAREESGKSDFQTYPAVAALLDSNETARGAGAIWEAGSFRYQEAAATATDEHITTAAGVKLYILPGDGLVYSAAAFGIGPGDTDPQLKINAALARMPEAATLILPKGEYLLGYADKTKHKRDSTTSPNGGVHGAIYLEKDGQKLIGQGHDTHLNGQGGFRHVVLVRANRCEVRNLRAGNVTGQLSTAEAAAIGFEPSNFDQGKANGADIAGLLVEGCWLYDCQSGVTAHPGSDGAGDNISVMYKPSDLIVRNNKMTGIARQGVEAFQCNEFLLTENNIEMGDKGENTWSRAFRLIGSAHGIVAKNTLKGFSAGAPGYLGVEVSRSGWYSNPNYSELAGDIQISGNELIGFTEALNVQDSAGIIEFSNNRVRGDRASKEVIWMVRIVTVGAADPNLEPSADNKNDAPIVVISGNTATGITRMVDVVGRAGSVIVTDNFATGNAASNQYALHVVMTPNTVPIIHDLESIGYLSFRRNIWIMSDGRTVPPIRVGGLRATDVVDISDNDLTPAGSGEMMIHDGTGTVRHDSPLNNRAMPRGLFERNHR